MVAGRRSRIPAFAGLAAAAAVATLLFHRCATIDRALARSPESTRAHGDLGPDDGASPDAVERADIEATRRDDAPPPPPLAAGQVRFRATFRVAGGNALTYRYVEARPADGLPLQRLAPEGKGVAFVVADARCEAIDFSCRGFADVSHAITAENRSRGDLGAIVFEPSARLAVQIRHAPARADAWLGSACFADVERETGWGGSIQISYRTLATPAGSLDDTLAVPSRAGVSLVLESKGVRLKRRIADPADGETTVLFDFGAAAHLRGRLVHVPPAALPGLEIGIRHLEAGGDGLPRSLDLFVPVDDAGGFVFDAFDPGPFRLAFFPPNRSLREAAGSHAMAWDSARLSVDRELLVEPVDELVGAAVGPIDRHGTMADTFLLFSPDGDTDLWSAARDGGVAMVDAAALRRARTVCVQWGRNDRRRALVSRDRISAPRDGVVTLPVLEPDLPPATLVVAHNWFAPRDVEIELEPADPESPGRAFASWREQGLFEVTFHDVTPGVYAVVGTNYGFRQTLAAGVVLTPGETRHLDVEIRKPVVRRGVVTNWNELPAPLRPAEVMIGESVPVKGGAFEVPAPSPLPDTALFTFSPRVPTRIVGPVDLRNDGTIAVRVPAEELELFTIAARTDGDRRIGALVLRREHWRDETMPRSVPFGTPGLPGDGTITFVHRHGEPVRGCVQDWARDRSADARILTWFSSDVALGTAVPAGRTVEVTNATDGPFATLELVPRPVGGWQPPRAAVAEVSSLLPVRIWLPDGAEALLVRFPGAPDQRIESAAIGAELVVRSP